MPACLLSAHIKMLPRIEAEETVRLTNAVALAFGSMSKESASAFQRRLQEQMGSSRIGATEDRTQAALRAAADLGVPVKRGAD